MTAGWCTRTVRAATFAALCVVLAAVGHVATSGTHVPWWALAAAVAATGPAAWRLAGRERGLVAITSATVAAQAVLHASFSLAQAVAHPPPGDGMSLAKRWAQYVLCAPPELASRAGAGATPAAEAMRHGTAHHHGAAHHGMDHGTGHGMGSMPVEGSAGPAEHAGHIGHGGGELSSLGMLGAHLLVALLCGLWLAYGEKAVFRILHVLCLLAGWLAAPLVLPLTAPPPPVLPKVRCRPARAPHRWRLPLVHSITSRGPPAGVAVR